jgi:competence protein ComEC
MPASNVTVSGEFTSIATVIGSGDLTIHFLELGNKYVGDSVYINYGDMDIVIDAGSKQASAATITKYIDTHIKDRKLEYVIATHAHEDHISGFNTIGNVTGVLDAYNIGTIIDFPKTNSTTATYNRYVATRNKLIETGTSHYTALECYREENGAQRIFNLSNEVKLEILYSYYYENYSSNENQYSVCIRIIQGDKQYIFTADLEKDGEDRLVEYYNTNYGGLGKSVLYKGGHHGSNTSSNELLMAAIQPGYICVCTCAGTTEYTSLVGGQFPTQNFINRIAPYTDRVYLTSLVKNFDNNEYESFNGNIVFKVSGTNGEITVTGSNNSLKLRETQWFKDNRTIPANAHPDWFK